MAVEVLVSVSVTGQTVVLTGMVTVTVSPGAVSMQVVE
jgi:hypothetical protein